MKFLLVGNYGVGNLGDEALKEYFLRTFSDVNWVVLGRDVPRFPGGIRSFIRFDWLRTVRALRSADGMVFGGGSLFTDVESSYACFLWWSHAFWAWLFRKKIILAFQGVGPFRTVIGSFLTRWVVRRAAFISVRDQSSFELLQQWRVAHATLSFDPVFSLAEDREYNIDAEGVLVVIPRKNSDAQFLKAFDDLVFSARWKRIVLLSLQPDDAEEKKLCEALRSHSRLPLDYRAIHSLTELIEGVRLGSFILTQRYHGAVVALALGRELQAISQGNNDKLASIQRIIAEIPLHGRKEKLRQLVHDGQEALAKMLSSKP